MCGRFRLSRVSKLANRLDIDVSDAMIGKLASNDAKYPVEQTGGKAY